MKRRVIAFLGAVVTLLLTFALPTFADSLDGVAEDNMIYGQYYEVDVGYRPPNYEELNHILWQPWANGFVENTYKGAWNATKTQYVYMRVPKDSNDNPIGAISIVFEDENERMWLIRDYSVRFQWWRNDHGDGNYEYVSEIVFTNSTYEGVDQVDLCFRWSSYEGYGLYEYSKGNKIKNLTGYISLYYNPGDIYGISTYSNGGSWYGLTNWYTAFGQVDEMLTPSYYAVYNERYDEGFKEGNSIGFSEGHYEGYHEGYADAYDIAFDAGKDAGVTDAYNDTASLKQMIFAVVESPVVLIEGMLDFDIFGFNLFGLVKTIVTLAVVAAIAFVLIKLVT